MKFDKRIEIANDNAPEPQAAFGFGLNKGLTSRPVTRPSCPEGPSNTPYFTSSPSKFVKREFAHPKSASQETGHKSTTFMAGFEMITLSGLIICLFAFGVSLFALPDFILGSAFAVLVFSALSILKVELSWRALEMTALAPWLIISIVGSLGLNSLNHVALLAGGVGLTLSYFTKTRLPALMGSLSLLALSWLHSPFVMTSDSMTSLEGAVMTAYLFGYLALAGRLSSRGILTLALLLIAIWGGIWLYGSDLSLLAISSFVFISSAALYQFGKAALNENAFGATAYIVCGWAVGFMAFLFLQNSFFSAEADSLNGVEDSAFISSAYVIGICCALACFLASGFTCYKQNHRNFLSLFLTTLALATVSYLVFFPDSLQKIVTQSNLSGFQATGLILSAFGLFAALSLCLKGLRQRRNLWLYLGFSGLGAQTVLLLQSSSFTIESVAILGAVFLILVGLARLTSLSKS